MAIDIEELRQYVDSKFSSQLEDLQASLLNMPVAGSSTEALTDFALRNIQTRTEYLTLKHAVDVLTLRGMYSPHTEQHMEG